jgi:transcriptional regulator with XRE-family HTH domain
MLGETIRETRIKKGLTQAKLARLAGVSRRHLAALEKGANVSVLVLRKVAGVLDMTEIHLGDLSLRATAGGHSGVNIPLLTDTIREARAEAMRAQVILTHAEDLLSGNHGAGKPAGAGAGAALRFPLSPVIRLESSLRESATPVQVKTAGAVQQGEKVDESAIETVLLPAALIEKGELVFRVRGDSMRPLGIHDGDLLVVELRSRGRAANGELVMTKAGETVYIGRWWQKHGQKAVMADGLTEIATGKPRRTLKVLAAVNAVVRTQ